MYFEGDKKNEAMMKNILVPVDFTEPSLASLKYALKFAEHFESNIYVVHVYKELDLAGAVRNLDRILKEEHYSNIHKMLEQADVPEGVDVFVKIIQGNPVSVVRRLTQRLQAELIIVGAKNSEDRDDLYLGRTAGALVKEATSPLLIVPEGYEYKNIDSLLLAVKSLSYSEQLTLHPLQSVLEKFAPAIKLVKVQVDNENEPIQHGEYSFESLLGQDSELVKDESVYTALATCLENNDPDLVCVVRRNRGFFEKLLTPSTTVKKDFFVDRPLLVLIGSK